MRGPFPPGMRSPHIIIIVVITIIMIIIMIRPRHLVSPTLRSGGRGGRALAGLSPPPRPPLHLFRSPSPTHGWSSSWFSSETQPPITINKICTPHLHQPSTQTSHVIPPLVAIIIIKIIMETETMTTLQFSGLIRITPRHLPPSYRPRQPSPSLRPFPPSPLHRWFR